MVAKDAGNGDGFIKVIEVSGRAVGIDVVDVFRFEAGVFYSQGHALGLLEPSGAGAVMW